MRPNPSIRVRLRDMVFEAIPLYDSGEGILMAQGAWIDLTRTTYQRSCGTIIDFTVAGIGSTRSPVARYWGARYWGLGG